MAILRFRERARVIRLRGEPIDADKARYEVYTGARQERERGMHKRASSGRRQTVFSMGLDVGDL